MVISLIFGVKSMATADNLKNIINRQKEVLSELETEQQILANSDLTKENKALKAELDKLRTDFEKFKNRSEVLTTENASLKNALYEQIYNEKIKIMNSTKQKLDVYFRSSMVGELNKLTVLENNVKSRIHRIRMTLIKNNIDATDEIYAKLDELSLLLNHKVTEARAHAAKVSGAFSEEERQMLESLKNEQITDEQVRAVAKKNNIERFVGLNVLNIVGIFLLVIGVITAAQYSYMQLPDLLKGIMMFTFGGIMLVAGEVLNRKKANVFSLGLSAGGIAILFVALAVSYFGLEILDMYPAIALCLLITAGAFVLSNRYNSQTIAAFAMVGGYLPIFSIGASDAMIYGAMVYFIVLNLLAVFISFSKKWHISSFIGLFLNIIGTSYITWHFYGSTDSLEKALTILYVLFAFFIYTAIPMISTYRTSIKFKVPDIVLLAINTLFSSLMMYGVFYSFDLEDYNGLLAVIFAVTYLFLGRLTEKKFTQEGSYTKALFYLTGLAFVVLIIPLQFGEMWLSLGWLVEGVLLAAYGIWRNEKRFQQVGLVISALCLLAFIMLDLMYMEHYLFPYKYLAITLGSFIILGMYMYKKMMAGSFAKVYKYFVLANGWLYTLYIIGKLGDYLVEVYPEQTTYNIDYLITSAWVVATLLIAYVILRIKILSDIGTKILSVMLYIFGIMGLFLLNMIDQPVDSVYLQTQTPAFGITLIGTLILVVLGLLSVLAMRDLMNIAVAKGAIGMEWYPLVISGYFIVILTQNLITQFGLSFASSIISIIYVVTALMWIIFGFMRRYSFIRHFGLGLSILAVVKLFLIDLTFLTQGYRIASYFALGITLLAISFVYQYFSKRLELKEVVPVDSEEDH